MRRAVDTTKKLKLKNPDTKISVLGELIHNSHVICELENLGINTLKELPHQGDGICIIRSHGESEDIFNQVQKTGFKIVDLTCFDVKKVQSKAIDLAKNDYLVIILGKPEHPEVMAICANAKKYAVNPDNIYVCKNLESLILLEDKIKNTKKVGVVLQTTQTKEFLKEVVDYLTDRCSILTVQNTICPSTTLRQNEAKKLATESDLMVVVGSKKSANTTHLAELLRDITSTIHIENESELENYSDKFINIKSIGITAGASTPDDIIKSVVQKIENIIRKDK
ncbi:MAG: 4-hydroxy-3-methylbut-2-enyl diphosphate reductase [Candidatus Gastranaerophilales bacterium]|nr:4-hydroxy-3-methylbut-2-enyl diphosphate reductase [Candidatus Gastranaerophilales bacterium]